MYELLVKEGDRNQTHFERLETKGWT